MSFRGRRKRLACGPVSFFRLAQGARRNRGYGDRKHPGPDQDLFPETWGDSFRQALLNFSFVPEPCCEWGRAGYGWQACLLPGIYFYRPESRFKRCFDDLGVKFSLLFNRFITLFLVNSRVFSFLNENKDIRNKNHLWLFYLVLQGLQIQLQSCHFDRFLHL